MICPIKAVKRVLGIPYHREPVLKKYPMVPPINEMVEFVIAKEKKGDPTGRVYERFVYLIEMSDSLHRPWAEIRSAVEEEVKPF